MGAPVSLLPSPFTEPSAVAPDPKVYFDVSAPKIKEFTEAGLRQPASDAALTSSIRRYRARFCNNRAHLEVTHN
jgi:hypothetical protein